MVFSSDDDSDLEVLPPPSRKPKPLSNRDDRRPRLSYSGATIKDPVNLLIDDDKASASQSSSLENCKNASNLKTQKKPSASHLTSKSMGTADASKRNVFDDDDSSDDSLAALAAKVKRRKPREPDNDPVLLSQPKGPKEKPVAKVRKTKSVVAKKPSDGNSIASSKPTKMTKAAEKKLAVEERKRQRELKKATEEAEKESKRRHVRSCQQISGKLAQEEIAILLDTSFHHEEAAGTKDPTWAQDLQTQTGARLKYLVVDHRSTLPGTAVVQWIRKNAIDGGADAAVKALHTRQHEDYEHIPVVAIVADDAIFLDLVERSAGEDDYPKLAEWIKGIDIGWRASWRITDPTKQPRIILLLDRVQEALELKWASKSRKTKKQTEPRAFLPTMEEFHDALTWIMIQFRVDSVHCKTHEDIRTHLTKSTRFLSERPYVTETSELECVKKIPQHCDPNDVDEVRIQDTFCRQLQQVPRVSRIMALSVVSNYYPSLQSLWEDYTSEDHGDETKHYLLAHMFNAQSQQLKLAKQVHTILTSDDPTQILN